MRCSCKECGTYMIQADSDRLGCVCPDCGYRCRDCLGTDTVVSREHLLDLARDPRFFPEGYGFLLAAGGCFREPGRDHRLV